MVWLWVLIGIVALILIECIREVYTFRVTYYQIHSPKLQGAGKHTVVLLSDLHGQSYGRGNARLLRTIREQHPEFILIAGDMLIGSKLKSPHETVEFIRSLTQICPVYYANGNHEQRLKEVPELPGTDYEEYRRMLEDAGVHYLENKKAHLIWEKRTVEIYGLELPNEMYKKFQQLPLPDACLYEALGKPDQTKYNILIAHNPVYAEEYARWGADLIVSGHLHGGIARIPYWRGMISPQGSLFPKYSGELSRIGDTSVVVSKGIGIHTIRIRFLNPAEVVVLHVGNLEE